MSLPSYQNEEISTIFVVGFPDNMQEREFQNMFTFSTGFEAATLKIPQSMEDENGVRKQIIGFAKFRTRDDALRAKELLSGRKVDAEKGCMLKAEMAKKNLHTKRGLSIDNIQNLHPRQYHTLPPTPTAPTAPIGSGLTARRYTSPSSLTLSTPASAGALSTASSYDPFHSMPLASPLPSDLLSPSDYASIFSDVFSPPSPLTPGPFSAKSESHGENGWFKSDLSRAVGFNRPPGLKAGESKLDADDATDYLSKSTPALTDRAGSGKGGFGALWLDEVRLSSNALSSPSLPSPNRLPLPSNPADQNPPCNTLYVGNLPHAATEDELRQLFGRCAGYKRLCFRTKVNGPMCFVEFETIEHATLALAELQGSLLPSSVKGGIRLSFSKNPLGVRPNPTPPTPTSTSFTSTTLSSVASSAQPTPSPTPPLPISNGFPYERPLPVRSSTTPIHTQGFLLQNGKGPGMMNGISFLTDKGQEDSLLFHPQL
ncbi:uncharacterized protein VTP21DRAFT_2172 [Calcarisporiella thermophila]|uniref:uncharacterized protein n=1 Tax=Calcarisporiella thermophila TaxID=911321 RepID=UPI00374421E5